MAGGDRVALVLAARAAQQRPELHGRVAVDAWDRRAPVEIRAEERIEHTGLELPLEIEHVERDAQLAATRRASSAASAEQQLFFKSE